MKTPQQLRDLADAMEAYERGEAVEYFTPRGKWVKTPSAPAWREGTLYRPAPKPLTRPWSKPEDVPAFCWLRRKTGDGQIARMVISVMQGAVCTNGDPREVTFGFIHNYEYSTDRINWQPCVVTEGAA